MLRTFRTHDPDDRLRPGVRLVALSAMVLAACLYPSEERAVRSERRVAVMRPMANRRGRPRKFSRPAKAVTLTLPEDVIATLKGIDTDISRAIVRTIEPLMPLPPRPPAELTRLGNRAVIVVSPTRELVQRTGVELLHLSDGRALLAFDNRLSVEQFELRLRDALADAKLEMPERATFESLAQILRESRQRNGSGLHERSIIVLEGELQA